MIFPPSLLANGPKVDTKKALVLIDLQNDFVTPSGGLPVDNTESFIKNLPPLIRKFRENGEIIWISTIYRRPCSTFSPQTGGYGVLLKSVVEHINQHLEPDGDENDLIDYPLPTTEDDAEAFLAERLPPSYQRCCLPNTKGAELPPVLSSVVDGKKDIVTTKEEYSAFANPSLVLQLRARLISDLYICGSLSNVGVYATVVGAMAHGFKITLVEDCLGFRDDQCHLEAMRQMADIFGVSGIDYQELMDDLHGLLGDVIPASRYTRRFQLGMQTDRGGRNQLTHAQKVSKWMETMEQTDSDVEDSRPRAIEHARSLSPVQLPPAQQSRKLSVPGQLGKNDSSAVSSNTRVSAAYSPPRKRSTSDRDELELVDELANIPHTNQEPTTHPTSSRRYSVDRAAVRNSPKEAANSIPVESSLQVLEPSKSKSMGHIPTSPKSPQQSQRTRSEPNTLTRMPSDIPASFPKKKSKTYDPTYLDQGDTVGEGDTRIVLNVLKTSEGDEAFLKLKQSTAWQKMYHRTGEVPRLVAVQGTVDEDGSIPIYRHPADESPGLLPFDENVDWLRRKCEYLVGHPLNHVLMQYYRSGEDNISEHSDKTLDIVPGSSIVNLSLGAMRTMTLRTKKLSTSKTTASEGQPRTAQRIRLAHNSAFLLGQRTNANWLHAIRADKRPDCEKLPEELDFDGERISLTFRQIGTFVDLRNQLIWGQGATSKTKNNANSILTGIDAERVGEEMIIGFGKENHQSLQEFDWQDVYGSGFDVVNFDVKPTGG